MQWNADSKACRRTSLGPTMGGPVATLAPLVPERPNDANGTNPRKAFCAYATAEKVRYPQSCSHVFVAMYPFA